ncbi:MAG TPA: TetR/AcrR family transcriptional regulator [Pseudomonadales bacterium]
MSTAQAKPRKARKPARAGRPPGSSKEDTLARILPVARRHFAEKGFAQATFKEIGAEIGVTHAALYAYFPSKQALYLATFTNTQSLLLPRYLEAIARATTLRERITGILMASAEEHDKDSSVTGFLAAVPIEMRRHPELHDALMSNNNDVLVALEGIFTEAQAKGEIRSDIAAADLVSALFGGGVGVALFQYGLQAPLTDSMKVFVALIEASLFQ